MSKKILSLYYFKPLIEEPVEILAQETEHLVIEETTEAVDTSKQVTTKCPQDQMSRDKLSTRQSVSETINTSNQGDLNKELSLPTRSSLV